MSKEKKPNKILCLVNCQLHRGNMALTVLSDEQPFLLHRSIMKVLEDKPQ